jgi:hypothetical protein
MPLSSPRRTLAEADGVAEDRGEGQAVVGEADREEDGGRSSDEH